MTPNLTVDNLHPYQNKAVRFVLSRSHAALYLGLGLGKTIITLTAIEQLINSMAVNKVLIVAPLRVANSVWVQEASRWSHTRGLKMAVCTGPAKERVRKLMNGSEVCLINRENIPWLVEHFQGHWPFDMIVIDEASSFKNAAAKRFKALKRVRPFIERSIQLTGTPASNGLVDLWSQVWLLDMGARLGRTKRAYLDRYFRPDYMGYRFEPRKGAEKQIHAAISDIVLSLQTEDYLDLPPRIDSTVKVFADTKVMDHYHKLERDFILALGDGDDEIEAFNAAALANKMLQFSNGHVYDETGSKYHRIHDTKLEALKELIDDNAGEPVLVAYSYRSDIERIREAIPSATVLDKDPASIDRWNRGEIPVLLVHPASAGHGLNLQAGGCLLIWYGLPWSLEGYEQLCGRLHRQGQTRPVRIVHLVCEGMLDEKVLSVLGTKARTQTELLIALKKGGLH